MKQGTLCTVKNKKQSMSSFLVFYSDIEEVLRLRNVCNEWLPSMISDPSQLSQLTILKHIPTAVSSNQPIVFLEEKQDENGKMYFRCLCRDVHGWIIASSRHFEIVETTENHATT